MTFRRQLGAPGVYQLPPEPVRALMGERMDVCAFVGVAPRGPAKVPLFDAPWSPRPRDERRAALRSVAVPVEGFDQYERLFGGFEGPGRLPYAVAAFFENGGRRAFVVRIVHDWAGADPLPSAGVASGQVIGLTLDGTEPFSLKARNEGSWGNSLAAAFTFSTQPLLFDATLSDLTGLMVARDAHVGAGTLLRLRLAGGAQVMRFCALRTEEWRPEDGARVVRAQLDATLPALPIEAELVEATVEVTDGDTRRKGGQRRERFEQIGLSSLHPRWLARVLIEESNLVYPESSWLNRAITVMPALPGASTVAFIGGADRYPEITPADFFGFWTPEDERPAEGVYAVAENNEVALLCAPDLYHPAPLVEDENIEVTSLAGASFAPCFDVPPSGQDRPPPGLDGLRLDPNTELAAIIAVQQRLAEAAKLLRQWIALLDAPPGLSDRRLLQWRSNFDTAFTAGYHPWLWIAPSTDDRDARILLNPSAMAAGIIAKREIEVGVHHGPANVIAAGAVDVLDRVSPARHDRLHPEGINVFLLERDGVRLTAARTMSLDPAWRQLSVRRLMTMLQVMLQRQMQWVVFEPNNRGLRADLTRMLTSYLRMLHVAGAFSGEAEHEAFFVRCDDVLNPPRVSDAGQLIAQIGVAPAEPLEFIVFTLLRDGDGALTVEARA